MMKNYSQSDEQKHILEYFRQRDGIFLDIGAYHPETFSNTRALFEQGWVGVCVEPSKLCYETLKTFYSGTGVEVYHCGISTETKVGKFWDSNGDALSTTDVKHKEKWERGYGSKFTEMEVQFYTLEDLTRQSAYKSFNFVNIDVENDLLGIAILKQLDLYSVGMVCLECSYDSRAAVKEYMAGWKEVYSNAENILLCR